MISRDLLWKGIITSMVDDFLTFFFSDAFGLFDLDRGIEFLDKELEQIFPDSVDNQRFVDKLIKVFLRDGGERYFLIHVEIQGYTDPNFSERMFVYFYRLYDRYRVPITALAILTDGSIAFNPQSFHYKFLGTELTYRFRTYNLAEKTSEELEKQSNPFAIIMETARIALDRTVKSDRIAYELKFHLVRKMIERGLGKEKIRAILNFIIYYQPFSSLEMSRKFEKNLKVMEETKGLVELIKEELIRQTIEQGVEQGLEQGLERGREQGLQQGIEQGLQQGIEQGLQQGIEQGLNQGREEVIRQLLSNGLSLEALSQLIQVPIEELEKIKNKR